MRKKEIAFRKKKRNKKGTMLVLFGVVVLIVVVSVRSISLRNTKAELQEEMDRLEQQIADEETRAEELQMFETYTHTKMYAEEVATEVLGYVYDGEIVFQLEE